jgi:hypothetical protein
MENKSLGIGSRLRHNSYGEGILIAVSLEYFRIQFFKGGMKEISRESKELEVMEIVESPNQGLSLDEVEEVLYNIVAKLQPEKDDTIALGNKWTGGKLVMEPGDTSLQAKEIPIETFFHKIVMVRDRLRVLEQNINSHKVLSDEEKIHLQQYITRIYGSLTTFNVLFKNKDDYFKGEGGR